MKRTSPAIQLAALFATISLCEKDAYSQGTFLNLDFEAANVPLLGENQFGGLVPVGEALPGWTAYTAQSQVGMILHNNITLAAPAVAIFGPRSFPSQILQGNYSVLIQPSTAGQPPQITASIGQTGQVPDTAHSLTLFARIDSGLEITFAGQPVSFRTIGSGPSYNILGADISPFAGQIGELRFTGGALLDNIQFSSTPVPEPGTWALFGLGGALLCGAVWRRGK